MRIHAIAAGLVLILVSACSSSLTPSVQATNDNEFAFPPGAPMAGRSVALLTADWWQWAMSMPDEVNPVRDRTGAHCGMGQRGEVWFLAGGFGSSRIHRVCTVPYGKTLLFPVVNMVYWPARGATSYSCEQARASAALNNDSALDLFVELDGVAAEDVKRYRVSTEQCFDVFGRIPVGQRPNGYPAASDGYWMALKPLAPGHHTLKFGGRYNRASAAFGRMVQDIEYEIIVSDSANAA